nr:MAG TPA: hypothetical protein [Herelleviridae sp.]
MKHVIKHLPIGLEKEYPFYVDADNQMIYPYNDLPQEIFDACNVRLFLDYDSKIRIIAKMGGKRYENNLDKLKQTVDRADGLWNLIYKVAFEGKELLIASNKDSILTLAHSLFIKSKSLNKEKKLVEAFDGTTSVFRYSSLAEFNFNQAQAQLKLAKNLEKFCKIVVIKGDEVYVNVEDENRDILEKVVNDLYSDIKFYVRWLN